MDDGTEPRNEDPAFISDSFNYVISFVQSYGWLFVGIVAALFYLKVRFSSRLAQWEQSQEDAAYKKMDGSEAMKRHEALERSRAKLQAVLDMQAKEYAERMKEKDEKKRQDKLADWEADQKGKSRPQKVLPTSPGSSNSSLGKKPSKNSSLRPAYNPLMGDQNAFGYRPTRRGGGAGGG